MHKQCVGCECNGKRKTEGPCCRFDTERERALRMMDDPVLVMIHKTIMILAEDWVKNKHKDREDWYVGRVLGALHAWCRLVDCVMAPHARVAYQEYQALVGY